MKFFNLFNLQRYAFTLSIAFEDLDLIYSQFPRSTTSSSPSVRSGYGVRGVKSIRDSELYCPPPKTWEQAVEEDNSTTNGLPPPPPSVHGKGASQGQSGQPCEREDRATTACAARRMDSEQSLSISIHGPVFTDEPREGEVKTNQPPTKWQKWMARMNPLCACRR